MAEKQHTDTMLWLKHDYDITVKEISKVFEEKGPNWTTEVFRLQAELKELNRLMDEERKVKIWQKNA